MGIITKDYYTQQAHKCTNVTREIIEKSPLVCQSAQSNTHNEQNEHRLQCPRQSCNPLTPSADASVLDVSCALALEQHEHLVARTSRRYAVELQLLDQRHNERRDACI